MTELMTVCLVCGVMLQLIALFLRVAMPLVCSWPKKGAWYRATCLAGAGLMVIYACRDADFTLLSGQIALTCVSMLLVSNEGRTSR